MGAGNIPNNDNNNTNDDELDEQIEEAIEEAEGPTSLSVDNQSSNTSALPPSRLEYVKQTLLFLPKKGRKLFYRTRYSVSSYMQSRGRSSSSGGLTPVDTVAAIEHDPTTTTSQNNNTSSRSRRRNNNNTKNNNTITQSSSLFRSPTTPCILRLLLPLLLITNHVLFYHAQTKPMWNLTYKIDVTISAKADTLKSKAAADALNVPHSYNYTKKESAVVETFTYMDAIRKLWKGEGLGDARTISKVAAALLVVFSGIWPHLKLVLVNLCWFLPFVHGLWLGDACRAGGEDDEEEDEEDQSKQKCCCRKSKKGCCNKGGGPKKSCSLCCSNGHTHQTSTIRSPFLRTLSTLGKWSLADVLVVCILIAVLHLDWKVDPHEIRAGIEKELPTLLDYAQQKYPDEVSDCTRLLGYTCGKHAMVLHYPACLTCQTLIKNAYHHPEWTTNEGKDILEGIDLDGGGYAQLRVMGMSGTYYFCGAVIMSILLGLLVDWMDERDRAAVEEDLLDRKRELEFILVPATGEGEGEEGGLRHELSLREEEEEESPSRRRGPTPLLNEALMSDDPSSLNASPASYTRNHDTSNHIPTPTTNCHLLKHTLLILLSIASLPLVYHAVTLPTMQRLVYGGGPTLLHEVLGMIWEKEYSLITLVQTTGDAGGWDTFLMITFGMFAVIGPIARSTCLVLHVLLGLPVALLGDCIERRHLRRKSMTVRRILYRLAYRARRALLPVIDGLGAFMCWEVLLIALVMIQLEMPSITDTIYQDDRCLEADPEHGRTCIEVQFNATDDILVVGIAWAVLILASGLAMDLAGEDEELDGGGIGVGGEGGGGGTREEKRYEFGMPIPQRRSNLSRDRSWMGSSSPVGKSNGSGARDGDTNDGNSGGNNDDGEDYYSPLQGGSGGRGRDNGLEQIVFV